MRAFLSTMAVLSVLWGGASGCILAPSPRKPATVNVAAFVSPGGGAPPAVLSLYKAALEVSKNAVDFDLRISNISPAMPDPSMFMEKQQVPPSATALEQAMGQDPPPDIVLFWSVYDYSAALDKDLLQPLDTYFRGDRDAKPDDYYPGAIEAVSDAGRLYALPVAVAPTVLMYDKRVFDEVGLGAPEPSWNWATFLGYAKQLTRVTGDPQKDSYAINLSGPLILPAFIWQNGGDVISKDGRRSLIAEPSAAEAIQFYADLINTYKIVPPEPRRQAGGPPIMMEKPAIRIGPGEVPPLMGPTGRVAMMFVSGAGSQMSYSPFMRGGQDRPMRLTELPRGKMPGTVLDLSTALGLTARATNSQLAYKAMVALASEMQKELGVPARRSLAKNLRQMNPGLAEDDAQVIVNSLEYARPLRLRTGEEMQVLYQKLLSPIQQNSKPVAEVLKEASDALDELLNK
ncbi:MAG: extracellular solute-binding protein [Chloroflexi bacterium]|nr:extracellular solute-binding protein [Chloroflexota bacterium]